MFKASRRVARKDEGSNPATRVILFAPFLKFNLI